MERSLCCAMTPMAFRHQKFAHIMMRIICWNEFLRQAVRFASPWGKNPSQVQERLDECARLIDSDQLEQAKSVLSQLASEMGSDNPDILYLSGLIEFMMD